MRIINSGKRSEIKKIMHDIGVDPYGAEIMLKKAINFLILLKDVNNIAANILKQEMLSLGADAAIARGSLTGSVKKTDVLLIGSFCQFDSLKAKLQQQPFGLKKIGLELEAGIKKYNQSNFILALRNRSLNLSKKTHIMGIINLTSDSFSGDGLYKQRCPGYINLALKRAQEMTLDGADIIDLGGQSSRPGAKTISAKEELLRILPVVKLLAKKIKTPISIDTEKPEVARAAIDNGAQIINDISGLRNKQMVKIVAKSKSAVVIMHMLGKPINMQKVIAYRSLIDDISIYLKNAINLAQAQGIAPDKIIIDPGLGFGKTPGQNLQIIKNLADFKILGKPILTGPSRKSFIGNLLGDNLEDRITGTLASCIVSAQNGASIVRVHDVKVIKQALTMAEGIENADK